MNIAQRSINSVAWNLAANAFVIIILFVRSVLLANLLPVDVFGTYGLANSVIRLSVVFVAFGMSGAFIHRVDETKDENQIASVHFTLTIILLAIWLFVIITGSLLFSDGSLKIALLLLAGTTAGTRLTHTPRLILMRRVVHRRIALFQIVDAIATTILAVYLAWMGYSLFALLVTDIVTFVLNVFVFYIWKPIWKPKIAWSNRIVRYLFSFGSKNLVAEFLLKALDRIDDLWTGFYLGETSLGFYSRAYSFATYPSVLLAKPVNSVSQGTFANFKGNEHSLSRSFFQTNAFLIRMGFLIGGGAAIIAPEFIQIFLGEKWLPMLGTFRLMLIFALLNPLKMTLGNFFTAIGYPEIPAKSRIFQLVILIGGLYIFGIKFGINGVAVAVNIMMFAGILHLFLRTRQIIRVSARVLFMTPVFALIAAFYVGDNILSWFSINVPLWGSGTMKGLIFVIVYIVILLSFEYKKISASIRFILNNLFNSTSIA